MSNVTNTLLALIVKLLTSQKIDILDDLKKKLSSDKMKLLDSECDGIKSITVLSKITGHKNVRNVKYILPNWELEDFIISIGSGVNKRYLAPENISIFLAHLQK